MTTWFKGKKEALNVQRVHPQVDFCVQKLKQDGFVTTRTSQTNVESLAFELHTKSFITNETFRKIKTAINKTEMLRIMTDWKATKRTFDLRDAFMDWLEKINRKGNAVVDHITLLHFHGPKRN